MTRQLDWPTKREIREQLELISFDHGPGSAIEHPLGEVRRNRAESEQIIEAADAAGKPARLNRYTRHELRAAHIRVTKARPVMTAQAVAFYALCDATNSSAEDELLSDVDWYAQTHRLTDAERLTLAIAALEKLNGR